jgi:hypothetical protein
MLIMKRRPCRNISGGEGKGVLISHKNFPCPKTPPHAGLNGGQEAVQNSDGMADGLNQSRPFPTVLCVLNVEVSCQGYSSPGIRAAKPSKRLRPLVLLRTTKSVAYAG